MPYKRPTDQYSNPNVLKEMIAQLQREEKLRKNPCEFSTVKIYTKLDFQGVPHAGTLAHVCSLEKGHKPPCKCADPCGVEFIGWNS